MDMLFTPKPDGGKSSSLIMNSALNETGESKRTFEELLSGVLKLTDLKAAQGSGKNSSNNESDSVGKGLKTSTPLAKLKKLLEDLGLPLSSVFLNPDGLPHMTKILSDSGFDQQSIKRFLDQLRQEPLSLERMLALLGTAPGNFQTKLNLPETSLPLFSRFFQELGLAPEQVKDMVSDLIKESGFDAETLRTLFQKHGHTNLKELNMTGVDQTNLREIFTEIGARSEDVRAVFSQLQKTEGKMSVEEFLTSLKTLTEPEVLKPNQIAHLGAIIQNLRFNDSLRSQPRFNRILSLIQSLGNEREYPNFLRNSLTAAVIRQGTVSSPTLLNSNGFNTEIENQLVGQIASGGIASGEGKLSMESWPDPRSGLNRPQQFAESVLKQVAEKLVYSSLNNRHWIRIQLEPKELGQLKINLIYSNNNLSARIVTENGFVKDALDTQWQQLSKTLSQQGINLERFDVSLDSGQAGLSKRSDDWGEPRRNRQSAANPDPSSVSQPLEEVHSSLIEAAILSSNQVDLTV